MNSEDYFLSKLMTESILPPPVSTANIQVSKPGFQFQYHSYDNEVEIICVLHGASYVGINNQFIRVQKNDCLLIFPKVTHNYFLKENESCKMIDLVFKPGDITIFNPLDLQFNLRFFHELITPHFDYLRFLDNGTIKGVLERILYLYEDQMQQSRMLLKLYFCELYVLLSNVISEALAELGKPKNLHVTHGLDYLVNFYSTQITVGDIAQKVGLSSRHFSRLFVQEMGMTVQDYITILRIRKAKDLLKNSDMDITRIAYAVGFNSSQYFITCFKLIEHVTPKVYRRMLRAGGISQP
jgi:AraC family transcriptional regulator, melibiose operon regulatory protein